MNNEVKNKSELSGRDFSVRPHGQRKGWEAEKVPLPGTKPIKRRSMANFARNDIRKESCLEAIV